MDNRKKVLISSHDSGGAEVVSSWVLREKKNEYQFLLEGPAVNIFKRKCGDLSILSQAMAFERMTDFSFVLTSSSWASDLEKLTIRRAKQCGVFTATFLDNWCNFEPRFLLGGELILPDELWVGDHHAFDRVQKLYPGQKIVLKTNYYFEEQVQQIQDLSERFARSEPRSLDGGARVLCLTAPLAESSRAMGYELGYTEFSALEGYLEYLKRNAQPIDVIRIRPHPAEIFEKYRPLIARYEDQFKFESKPGSPLFEDCAWADWVVGCDSMAMAIAVKAGKKVFSCIPKGGKPLTLPFPEIICLFQ